MRMQGSRKRGNSTYLVDQGAELVIVVRIHMDNIFRAGFQTFGAGNIQRTGKIIHHCVNQNLHAFFLEGRTAKHRNKFNLASEPADRRLQNQGFDGRGRTAFTISTSPM